MSTINELHLNDPSAMLEEQPATALEVATAMTPTERIEQNRELLTALAPVIKEKHLALINGQNYMRVGGGTAIANSLGYLISTSDPVWDKEKGAWKSCSKLIDQENPNSKPPEAWGFVGDDEARWFKGPKFALHSMVQTRASARVCRQNFGHMYVGLGADSDTPAEEMSGVVSAQAQSTPAASSPVASTPASKPAQAAPTVAATTDSQVKTATIKVDHVKKIPYKTGSGDHLFIVSKEGETYKTWDLKVYEEAEQYANKDQAFEVAFKEEEYQGRVTKVLERVNGWKIDIPF